MYSLSPLGDPELLIAFAAVLSWEGWEAKNISSASGSGKC
jgi:hypothetical protein